MTVKILLLMIFLLQLIESKDWSYDNVTVWSLNSPYCDGNVQSPIDIQFNLSQYSRHLQPLRLEERSRKNSSKLTNNGHTAQLLLKDQYILRRGALGPKEYEVEQLHFHWGHSSDNTSGSEHLLNNQSYPLEMHIVTYSRWFTNINDAMKNTRALAVIGAFFEISDRPNPFLEPLVRALHNISHYKASVGVSEDFNLKALLGNTRMHRYYRYDGSLTTPPCYESVVWSVLHDPIPLSFDQLHAFRSLHGDKSKVMRNTYRPTKALGTRKLFRSFYSVDNTDIPEKRMPTAGSGGSYLLVHFKLSFILLGLLMILV